MSNIVDFQQAKLVSDIHESRKQILFGTMEIINSAFGHPSNYLFELLTGKPVELMIDCTKIQINHSVYGKSYLLEIDATSELDPELKPFLTIRSTPCEYINVLPTPVEAHLRNQIDRYLSSEGNQLNFSFHLVAHLIRVMMDSKNVIAVEMTDTLWSINHYSAQLQVLITLNIYPQELIKESKVIEAIAAN